MITKQATATQQQQQQQLTRQMVFQMLKPYLGGWATKKVNFGVTSYKWNFKGNLILILLILIFNFNSTEKSGFIESRFNVKSRFRVQNLVTEIELHNKKSWFSIKSRFRESKCADAGHSWIQDFTV